MAHGLAGEKRKRVLAAIAAERTAGFKKSQLMASKDKACMEKAASQVHHSSLSSSLPLSLSLSLSPSLSPSPPRPRQPIMDTGERGNDRPGFGVHSITQKLSAYNIIRI
jgi:hypothetical protein